jgi:UDP-glucose 4-epimerase
MKAVVFGGSGFLGSHVADALTESGYEVIIFDRKSSAYMNKKQTMVVGDICDSAQVEEVMNGADYVFDFAGIADLDDASTRPLDTIELNIKGTCILIEACLTKGVKRFIYASSFYVHSEKGGFYRCSKQAAELYIEEYSRKYGLEFTILRYGSLYGTRTTRANGVYNLLDGALHQNKIVYAGTGEELREYIHVKDAAELSVKILEEEYKNKYIVLTGHEGIRVRDMIEMIREIMNKPIAVEYRNHSSELHYHMTPYNFTPKYSYKLTNNCYRDIGQGLIECLNEMYEKDQQEKQDD